MNRLFPALLTASVIVSTLPAAAAEPSPPGARLDRVPLAFVENRGQWDERALFRGRKGGTTAWIERDALTVTLERRPGPGRIEGVTLRLRFLGASAAAQPVGEGRQPGLHHFLLGAEREAWRTDVPAYTTILYRRLHEGVDLRVREHEGRIEYDLLLDRASDARRFMARVEGADRLAIGADGSLLVTAGSFEVRQTPPLAFALTPAGVPEPVRSRHRLLGGTTFGFEILGAPADAPVVIDPGLVWSSYLGGSSYEWAYDAAREPTGETTVVGETGSRDFPVTPGAFQTANGAAQQPTTDAFVTRIDAAGTALVWSTYLGGRGGEKPYAVATDGNGTVTVAGNTASPNFPTTPGAFQTALRGPSDVFVTRLNPSGSGLVWSTLLGGGEGDVGNGLVVDGVGVTTVTGVTSSADFPTTPGAFDRVLDGTSDAFVTRLDAAGSALLWSTFLGGRSGDVATAIAQDGSGAVTVAGVTSSTDFPTTPGAFQTAARGPSDAFVTRLAAGGSGLVWSTLLGGASGDVAEGLAPAAGGEVVVAGVTSSTDFPTTPGAFQQAGRGSSDAFVTRLNAAGTALVSSTLVGGGGGDVGKAVVVDSFGAAIVAGQTSSSDYPTTPGAFDRTAGGSADAFLTRVHPSGTFLLYSTYVGGGGADGGEGTALAPPGAAVLVGTAGSNDFPVTPGAPRGSLSGVSDAFATAVDLLPAGTARYGVSTPACAGPVEAGVTRSPQSGDPLFAFTCAGAPPSAGGFLGIGLGPDLAGTPLGGIRVHLSLLHPLFLLPVLSDARGTSTTPVPLASVPAGIRVFCQHVWVNTPGCGGPGTLSASDALDVTVQ